jgi:protein arginine kinase activator
VSCEKCGRGSAAITYTEYGEQGSRKLRICASCARELGFDVPPETGCAEDAPADVPVAKLVGILGIEAVIQAAAGRAEPDDPRECPSCGMTANELRKEPLFGCPVCYETFHESLDALFRRIHGAVAHRGRVPGGGTAGIVDVEALRRELEDALAREDYERAARLRDRLRQARAPGGPETTGDAS